VTVPADTAPLAVASLEQALAAMRARGMRMSTARRLVLSALFAAEGPVSAAHLAGELSLDAASVYRNLEMLEQLGVVRHVHLGHGPGLYVLRAAEEREYLYCRSCSAVLALSPAELEPVRAAIRRRLGHEVRFDHFALVGVCSECARAPGQRQAARGARPSVERPGERMHSHGHLVHAHAAAGAEHRH